MKRILNGIKKHRRFSYPFAAVILLLILITSVHSLFSSPTKLSGPYAGLMDDIKTMSCDFSGEVGIFVKDLATGETVGINTGKVFPSASLVKIPIMAAVYKAKNEGLLTLEETMELKWRHKAYSSKGLYWRRCGKRFSIRELVERMIQRSDNTATNMLVERLGFEYINFKCREFGLEKTEMRRGVMDLRLRNMGIENYTTPSEMAYLLEKIYRRKLVSREDDTEMLEILVNQRINDRIPRYIPDYVPVAHKTGTLKNTISDVGIVFTDRGDFIICVFTLNGRTWRTAKRFIGRVALRVFELYASRNIESRDKLL